MHSVVIKGMELPETCDDCPFNFEGDYCAASKTYFADEIEWEKVYEVTEKRRLESCPLEPALYVE